MFTVQIHAQKLITAMFSFANKCLTMRTYIGRHSQYEEKNETLQLSASKSCALRLALSHLSLSVACQQLRVRTNVISL